MDVQQIVNNVIEEFGPHDEISHVDLAKIAGFSDEEIEFVELFWDPAFNRSWILILKDMVVEWMGHKDSKNTMNDFYRTLVKNYEKDIEYKEIDQNDEIVKKWRSGSDQSGSDPHNKKYYIVSGECLKSLLMSSQTTKGKMVKKYYIKTENLVVIMLELVKKQQQIIYERKLKQKDELLEQKNEEIRQITDEKNWLHIKTKEKVSFKKYTDDIQAIYAGAHETELKNHIVKVGKSIRPATRIGDFSTSNAPLNAFRTLSKYNLPKEISHQSETFLHQLLSPYETKKENFSSKEHFMIHPTFVNYLIVKFTNIVQDLVRDINYHLTLLEDNNYDFDKVQEIIENEPRFKEYILKVKEPEDIITQIEIPFINNEERPESSRQAELRQQTYKEEILISKDVIDNETNRLKIRKMTKRNEFIVMMNSLGFKVISEYKTRSDKVNLLCQYNHIFTIKPCDHDLDKVACYECTNERKTQEATELVKDRNMVCVNYNEKKFRCKEGHEFISGDLNYILHKDGGCTVCNNRMKISKEDYHKIARINEGKWIEEEKTPTSREITKWICKEGHQFEAKYHCAKKSWNTQCTICKEKRLTLEYQEKINKKIAKYQTAELLSTYIVKLGQTVRFRCEHIPNGWEVKLDKWFQRGNWKCRKCKSELENEDKSEADEVSEENEVDNKIETVEIEIQS